jgi:hypothetical protein
VISCALLLELQSCFGALVRGVTDISAGYDLEMLFCKGTDRFRLTFWSKFIILHLAMKNKGFFIDQYLDVYLKLKAKNRQGDMRYPPWEFMEQLHHIFALQKELRSLGCFSEENMDRLLDRQTEGLTRYFIYDEPIRYEWYQRGAARKVREAMQAPFVAAEVKAKIQELKPPLSFDHVIYIYNALLDKHIDIYAIPEDVFAEFRQTRQFRGYFKKMVV